MIPVHIKTTKPSATLAVNEKSQQLIQQGGKVYKLGFGQSPFPVPNFLVSALGRHASRGEYCPVTGILELRSKIAAHYSKRDNRTLSADDVIIGPGSKELLYLVQLACQYSTSFTVDPSWVTYPAHMTMLNKKHTFIKTTFEEQWKVNKNNLSVIAPSTANPMLVLNTPNNPTGLSYSEDELSEIATVLKDRKAIVICDEIYEHLQYDNNFKSLATKLPSQSIISSGFSKSCGIGGWRIGYLVFPPELSNVRKAVVSLASETFSCVASPMQYAACEIFDPVHAPELKAYLAKSRKILHAVGTFCTRLLNDAHIRTIAPDGGFYIYPDFVTFIDKFNRNGINNSGEMTDAILEQTGVALLPSQEFGTDEGYRARLCFIDFDGTVAMSNCPEHTELTEDWLRHYCPNVIEGVEVLCKWCLALK